MDDVHLQHHIVVHKVGQRTLVGHYATYLGCRQEDILRFLSLKEGLHLLLACKVQLPMRTRDNIIISLALQFAHNGRAHHSAVTGHVNL